MSVPSASQAYQQRVDFSAKIEYEGLVGRFQKEFN